MDRSHKIKLVAFQQGQSDRLIFSNFLYHGDKQVLQTMPLRVSYQEKVFELDVKFIVVSSLKEINRFSLSKSQRLCDLATFVVQAEYSNKVLIEFFLSKYILSLLKDDWDENKKIHLFDLNFKNGNQRNGHSIRSFDTLGSKSLELISEFDGTGIFNAEICAHQSMTFENYKKLTGSDPINKKALECYFDPEMHKELRQRFSLPEYLKLERQQYIQSTGQ